MGENLAPAGSSQYSSNTLTVGDGTWDKSRNSFLLPNLEGLNFATMRYNGMGNRFKGLPEYHRLITGHGVLAAITFIGIVPLAIFLAKYGSDWPGGRVSFKLHVYLQIIAVFLTTVVIALGCFAVGPERSLSNPHHGIGIAIYVLLLVQFIYGSLMYRRERKRDAPPRKLPVMVYLHRLIGRSTAMLAFAQIGLGLTLYGSPKVLFILYAVAGFLLITAYLILEYWYKPGGQRAPGGQQPEFYSDYGSYVSGSAAPPPRRKEHHWGRDLLAAGGVFGAYEWWKHRRDRKREERDDRYDESEVTQQRPPPAPGPPPMGYAQQGPQSGYAPEGPPPAGYTPQGGPPIGAAAISNRPRQSSQSRTSRESWEDEKYSRPHKASWGNRILGATGAFAAFEGARNLFGRRRRRDSYSDDSQSRYGSVLGGNQNLVSHTDVSRVEAGQAPSSPDTPRVNMGGVPPMTPSATPSRNPRRHQSQDSRDFADGAAPRPLSGDQTLTEAVTEMGPIAGFREWNKQRKQRRELKRNEDMRRQHLESEANFKRRSSDRYPRPEDASGRRNSMSGTLMTGPSALGADASEMSRTNFAPDTSHPPLPAQAGTIPSSSQHLASSRQNITEQGYSIPPPPPGPPPNTGRHDGYSPPQFGSAHMPEGAVNPDPSRLLFDNTAANEASAYGRDPHSNDIAAAAAAGAAAAVAAGATARDDTSFSPTRRHGSRGKLQKRGSTTSGSASQLNSGVAGPSGTQDANSPPVSLKMNVANDGRSVTIRRLGEEEAAAERAARRQQRRDRRRRGSSLSSDVGEDPPPGRYRRGGPIRPSNDQPITNIPPPPMMSSSAATSQRRESELNLPPPPPVPQHSVSPQSNQGISPPAAPVNESAYGSPGDAGTGTDVSAFADNRKRRRAERARQQAARGGPRVEFE